MVDEAPPVTAETPAPLFGDTFTDVGADYVLGKRLGSGNFAKVLLGQSKRPQPQWRLKEGEHVGALPLSLSRPLCVFSCSPFPTANQ